MTSTAAAERRRAPRRTLAECAWLVAARLRPGRDVRILDLSNGGALVEGPVRLLPGAPMVLHLLDVRGAHTIRGKVVRCWVCALDPSTGVLYRAALAFEHWFVWPEDDPAALVDEDECDETALRGNEGDTGSGFPCTIGEIAASE